jgi:hypothetical protein
MCCFWVVPRFQRRDKVSRFRRTAEGPAEASFSADCDPLGGSFQAAARRTFSVSSLRKINRPSPLAGRRFQIRIRIHGEPMPRHRKHLHIPA